jgi:GNAT superfamily N-acetyltransferase
LDRPALLARYDEELRRRTPYFDADMRLERDGSVVRVLGATPDAGNNCVLYSALDEASAAATIDRQVAHFQGLRRDFEWKLHDHDAPATLGSLLLERGFEPGEAEVVMVFDLGATRLNAPTPEGYAVRPLGDAESLQAVTDVQNAVWTNETLDWLAASLARERAAQPERIRFHLAWSGELPVCAGWTRFHGSFASLFGGSTLKEHRGRGVYRAMLASRLDEARRRGASFALVDAGPMSHPILARLGFEPLTGTTPFVKRFSTPLK